MKTIRNISVPNHDNPNIIQLTDIHKSYTLHHEKPTLIEQLVKGKNESFSALQGVNLTIRKGDRVGIIGKNGSGKTTLLKIISRITHPTKGTVFTQGKITSLIDLNAGFHPDLSGVQNIYLNGMVLGMTKNEIDSKLSSIIRFAELHKFIDVPVFTYSEGMKLRLGFSVAVHTDPDVLILDEGLSVGDHLFQKKCQQYFDTYFARGKTLIVCLHVLDFIHDNCNRVVVMKNGRIQADGNTSLISLYEKE